MSQHFKPLNFFLVLCKNRKKFDKYVKLNKIRGKYIIDIKKMMDENDITADELPTSDLFKIIILKKFNLAIEKKKDIYYIPNFDVTKKYAKLFSIKELLEDSHNFNLLYFHNEFEADETPDEIINRIDEFDLTQLLKDF
jgi:hypothetical protein